MTVECIRSIYDQADNDDIEVIVIDNASADESARFIRQNFPQVRVIEAQTNWGFARANNIAAAQAVGDNLLLLNPDTVVLDNAVDRLVDFARKNPKAMIWGGRTVFGDGTLNPTSCWRFISLWSLFARAVGLTTIFRQHSAFNPEAYPEWPRDSIREVDIITGCFLLIDKKLWTDLSGFDETFFMYGEEADLCYRARRHGARPLFTPDARIVHYDDGTNTGFSTKTIRLLSAKIHFLNKHWHQPKRTAGVLLVKFLVLLRLVGYSCSAAIRFKDEHRAAAAEWSKVWSARHNWIAGYRRLPSRTT